MVRTLIEEILSQIFSSIASLFIHSDVMRSQQNPSPAILFIDEMHLITVGKSPGGQSSGMYA
jgi:hypothetical protein